MGDDWRVARLGELVEIFDGPHATPGKTESGPVFLGISNLSRGRLDLSDTRHLSEEAFAQWTRRVQPQPGDVVFSYETRLGEAAIIPEGLRCCLGRRMGLLRPKNEHIKINSRFLLFAYLGPEFQETLRQRTVHGSTVDRILLSEMASFPIRVPDISEQNAIAHILGILDDKIELNRRMNQTLEGIARALFKSWFVEFDPVRAKMEGRWERGETLPGLPADLYDLFPDRLVESELGEVPEGWDIVALTDQMDVLGGGTPKTTVAEYWGGEIPWFAMADLPEAGAVWSIHTERSITQDGLENSSTRLLPERTTILTARGTVGRVALTGVPMAMNQSCYGLRPRVGESGLYGYFLVRSLVEKMRQRAHGSVFDTITRRTLRSIRVVAPPAEIIRRMDARLRPMLEKVLSNLSEQRILGLLRDTLLPRLISGELRVSTNLRGNPGG